MIIIPPNAYSYGYDSDNGQKFLGKVKLHRKERIQIIITDIH
jgi:hypothetical protein